MWEGKGGGEERVAVVARDKAAKKLKGRVPAWSERKRMRAVQDTGLATKVVLGDLKEGSYAVIEKYRPDIICLGYDQKSLGSDLRSKMRSNALPRMTLYILKPHKTDLFRTSKLRA